MHAVTPARDLLGEGPWWDPDAGALTWVDIVGHAVRTWRPSEEVRSRSLPDDVSLALPCADGRRVVAQVDRLFLDDGERLEPLCEIDPDNPHTRLNDGVCDAQGRLWVGTWSTRGEPEAGLHVVTPDGAVRPVLTGAVAANGVGFSPDGGVLYATDTGHARIDRLRLVGEDLVPDGTLMAAGDGEGRPDGLTVDAEGCVWTALWGGGTLRRYAPDGTLLDEVVTPVTYPTSVALGGPALRTLLVTTSAHHLEDRAAEPWAGAVLAHEVDVPGLPVRRFG
ncbi:SMP-30/gluconolactonase/LRE family protein [Nocardioides anomalus]|uniref:SMP-30/gluconolactonase/LRE family protein n=1 Tax=Nocardioides anomalus TaxID=2712223 RepID=A0A6G6WH86_9ACTN|nr:SMP-30/gluconolactonase/LRE family protein [Nocardioides anomalus]QIG44592.1 SMP-30/gluconolactonase/LRE family protein [Nocardioides anomalus]